MPEAFLLFSFKSETFNIPSLMKVSMRGQMSCVTKEMSIEFRHPGFSGHRMESCKLLLPNRDEIMR